MHSALVLEGGGMRGIYTTGVLDFMLDKGLHFPRVYGVSAGACHACSYLSLQRGRAARTVLDYAGDKRYGSVRSLLRTGDYFNVQFVYHEIPDKLLPYDYDAYLQNPAELFAVVTDCETGEPAYLPVRDMRRDVVAVQASSSLPLLSRIVEIDGRKYLDGGLADSIPLGKSVADGNRMHVVILTQHRGFQKQPEGMQRLLRMRYRKYPALVRCIAHRHEQYNRALALVDDMEGAGRAVVIRPDGPLGIDRLETDKQKLRAAYDRGCADAEKAYDRLQAALKGESLVVQSPSGGHRDNDGQ